MKTPYFHLVLALPILAWLTCCRAISVGSAIVIILFIGLSWWALYSLCRKDANAVEIAWRLFAREESMFAVIRRRWWKCIWWACPLLRKEPNERNRSYEPNNRMTASILLLTLI